jgi:hypothetical protein
MKILALLKCASNCVRPRVKEQTITEVSTVAENTKNAYRYTHATIESLANPVF